MKDVVMAKKGAGRGGKKIIVVEFPKTEPDSVLERKGLVHKALADMTGREFVDAALWRITVPLPPLPRNVRAKRALKRLTETPRERLERERLERDREHVRAAGWVADPAEAESEATIRLRVVGGQVGLDEPDGVPTAFNRRAWHRIQEAYGQPIGLRLDVGEPAVTYGDGRRIPGQTCVRYGTRSEVAPVDLITRLEQCSYPPRLADDELDQLRAHLEVAVTPSKLQVGSAERERRRKLKEILNHNDELRCTAESNTASSFTVAALGKMTRLGNQTLNKYAKQAGVTTPRRGQRNFRYSGADVRKILETIIATTNEERLRKGCQAALNNLEEIAK